MRDYSKVSPKFWIGATGKALRKAGAEAQVVALYLMSSPHSNMIGLFYQPSMYIAHETGLGIEGASKGLTRAIEAGFCLYDEASEVVYVPEMARFQIGDLLTEADKRCKGVQNEYDSIPDNPFLTLFFDRYATAFHLTKKRGANSAQTSPSEAPSMDLRSQEQEQEQEQEQDQDITNPPGLVVGSQATDLIGIRADRSSCPHQDIIALYHDVLPSSPSIRDWTPARAAHLRARWAEDASRQNLEWWRRFFEYIADSRFLTGKTYGQGRKPFHAPLDWICKAENFAKIREGRFHEEATA